MRIPYRMFCCCFFPKRKTLPDVLPATTVVASTLAVNPYRDTLDYSPYTYENCNNFIPHLQRGKVIKVYDADSITLCSTFYEGQPVHRYRIRLNGIDAPEIKGKSAEEKKAAIYARDRLREKIFGKIVTVANCGEEKWGRVLADIYLEGEHINQWLLNEGLAVPYDGGTKAAFQTNPHLSSLITSTGQPRIGRGAPREPLEDEE
jgi:micrococcal nuclease